MRGGESFKRTFSLSFNVKQMTKDRVAARGGGYFKGGGGGRYVCVGEGGWEKGVRCACVCVWVCVCVCVFVCVFV